MTEIAKLLSFLRQQSANGFFSANRIAFEFFKGRVVERAMRVSVIAKLESSIDPHSKQTDSRFIALIARDQLVLVDEADRGNTIRGNCLEQFVGDSLPRSYVPLS